MRPDEIATAGADNVQDKSIKRSKEGKVWPAQAVKIESVAEASERATSSWQS